MSATTDLRLRQKQPPVGIAAGAEDAKYQAKYKELKRKVKDIETDNDKLHFKVLQAKLTIRRMKMERAILYERLATVPPSPTFQDRHPLPPMSVMQGPSGPQPMTQHRPPPAGQPQHRDYPFHPASNVDLDQQRSGGVFTPHVHPDSIRHHHHHHYPHTSHSRSGGGDQRMTLTPGDPRGPSDNPAPSSPRFSVHSPPIRIPSTHESSTSRPQYNSAPYESRGGSNIVHDAHHVHTSPPIASHPNAQVGRSHSRKRSHSHSSITHPPQIEVHSSAGHIHAAPPYRVLSSSSNSSNHGPSSGSMPGGPLGQPHPYPENLAPIQPPLHSPPLSEMEFGGRSHSHLHHQHPHPHGGSHQHSHSQHSHHHHVVHHHHHATSSQTQAQAQNEYGGMPVGSPPTSSTSPAIQAHGSGYDNSGSRGPTTSGPPGPANANSNPGPGRGHAQRAAYEYPPTTQSEVKRERDRDGMRERERDSEREWERERDRAREYSRGELINYSPPHRTRSSQSQPQSRPLSRTHSQSHLASGAHSQSQTAAVPSGEYEHSGSNSRNRTTPAVSQPDALHQYADQSQYREYPDSTPAYAPRRAPSRSATPANVGSGSAVGPSVIGTDNSGPRDREGTWDRGRQQQPTSVSSAVANSDNNANELAHGASDSGRKRTRNEMEMDSDGEYPLNYESEVGKGGRNGADNGGRETPVQPLDDPRGTKRYHRQADHSPERR